MDFGAARPTRGNNKKTASQQEVLAQAAADRAQRAAARQRNEAPLKLQAWRHGCIAARAARAAQLQAFDARLQGVARVKQQLPPGFRLPLPALCLLARSLVFALTARSSSSGDRRSELAGAAAVKLRATLSLLLRAAGRGRTGA